MQWEQQDVSDDQGRNSRRELVAVATDQAGNEWIVSPHDDGTYNWQRWAGGEPVDMGEGFATLAEAQAAAERYAATVLG